MATTTSTTRRAALRFGLAATAAAIAAPVAAAAPDADAELITLCDECLRLFAEAEAIAELDEHAPDNGPLHARYIEAWSEACARVDAIADEYRPTTPAGIAAVARVALCIEEHAPDGTLIPSYTWQKVPLIVLLAMAGRGEEPLLTVDERHARAAA